MVSVMLEAGCHKNAKMGIPATIHQIHKWRLKTESTRGPGRCDTSHLSDFNETWSK